MDEESLPWIPRLYEGVSCFTLCTLYVGMQFNFRQSRKRLKEKSVTSYKIKRSVNKWVSNGMSKAVIDFY